MQEQGSDNKVTYVCIKFAKMHFGIKKSVKILICNGLFQTVKPF